ncbi:glycosyltransferase family protein [Roseospira goensis]|uniref:Putative glycosyltransferase n=1 Tax=Roseospira goensis TaxID=391922 RepID=A0A7W6WLI9_9PROT|nr:glycosyltransferase [Roseospira goensis]MBB4287145.1 putative glycosyltransferase [Roseospira goensis]
MSAPLPPPPDGPILVYVQHVLGVGHLNRAAALARGLAESGRPVVLVTGGRPAPHLLAPDPERPVRVAQLPPLAAADLAFSGLVDETGAPVTDALWRARRDRLRALVEDLRPAVLVVEMYPFGRRPFGPEIDALIGQVRARRPEARVACSVRDILVRKRDPSKARRMLEAANRLFDLILVHGDPRVLPFSATFPLADALRPPVVHTGFVVEDRTGTAPPPDDAGLDEVLVSAGGGAMGRALMDAAAQARPLCRIGAAPPWRVLVGRNLGAGAVDAVRAVAAPGVTVDWVRPDFRALLARARLSVSQAGYNTVVETLAARCPAVLVPWGDGDESEQRDRAAVLDRLGLARALDPADLSPARLAGAVDDALATLPRRTDVTGIALDGIARTREALLG